MFKLADPDQTYVHQVAVPMPGAQGGDTVHTFNARFRLLPSSQYRALFKLEHLAEASDYEVIRQFLDGWEPGDILNHDGTDLPCSDETLRQLCDIHYWARAVVEAYIDFYTGTPTKNLPAPPATG